MSTKYTLPQSPSSENEFMLKNSKAEESCVAKQERKTWLDDVRGLCMFFVMISHINWIDTPILYKIYSPIFLVCFFTVSGYLFKGTSLKDHMKKIFRSLLIPYLLLSLVNMTVSLTFVRHVLDHTAVFYIIDELKKILLGTKFWFIACIIVVYLLYSIIFAVFDNRTKYYKIITIILGLTSVFVIRRNVDGSLPWSIDTAIYALGWFALGHQLKSVPEYSFKKMYVGKILSIFLLLLYITIVLILDWHGLHIYYDMGNNRFDNPIIQLVLSLFGCLAVCYFAKNFKFGPFFSNLGKNTLVAYVFHCSIGFAMVRTLFRLTHLQIISHYPYLYVLLFAFFVGLIMIGLSILFNKYLPVFVGKHKH